MIEKLNEFHNQVAYMLALVPEPQRRVARLMLERHRALLEAIITEIDHLKAR